MGIIKNSDGFINLVGAIMEQAQKDAEQDKDKALKVEAQRYIGKMQKAFS